MKIFYMEWKWGNILKKNTRYNYKIVVKKLIIYILWK